MTIIQEPKRNQKVNPQIVALGPRDDENTIHEVIIDEVIIFIKIFWGQNFDFQVGAQNRNVVCAESKIVLENLCGVFVTSGTKSNDLGGKLLAPVNILAANSISFPTPGISTINRRKAAKIWVLNANIIKLGKNLSIQSQNSCFQGRKSLNFGE